jgi:putative FmdB family regulatory protein
MPLYEYQCDACGHRFETIQRFSDPPLQDCPSCSGVVRKLISSPAIQFKGSGWYITDYARKGNGSAAGADGSSNGASGSNDSGGDGSKPDGKSETRTESKGESKGESKTETKAETKADSKPAGTASPGA